MGSDITWDNAQQTILIRTLSAPWSFDDISENADDLYRIIQQNGVPIGVIVHLTEPLHIPTNSLRSFQKLLARIPDEIVITVFVVPDTLLVRTLYGVVQRMAQHTNHIVDRTDNLEEARHITYHYLRRFKQQERAELTDFARNDNLVHTHTQWCEH